MAQKKSANHDGAAFSRAEGTSSQNADATLSLAKSYRAAVCVGWALGLLLVILLHVGALADATAWARISALFDHELLTWLETALGYFCIGTVAARLLDARTHRLSAVGASALTVGAYTYHTFLLRWPWLTGEEAPSSRLSQWSATLSTTWHGIPCLAFMELGAVGVVLVHACWGVSTTTLWRELTAASRSARVGSFVAAGL